MTIRAIVGVVLLGVATTVSGADQQSLNIVFIGDSITYGYLLTAPAEEAPPARAAAALQRMPCFSKVCFTNCGRNAFRTDQFLPGNPEGAWRQVKQAADSYTNKAGRLLFSVMLGANDSVVASPAQYGSNLTALVTALVERYPSSQVVVHHPLWYSQVPSTHPEILQQYLPVIDALVETFEQRHPGRVHLGDIKGWDCFEKNHPSICFRETRDNLPYYIHPNAIGAAILGQYWAEAIFRTCGGGVADAAGQGHAFQRKTGSQNRRA